MEQRQHYFPVAFDTLLATAVECQASLQEKLLEKSSQFNWFSEVFDEAMKLFSVKSTKLKEIPKTPSVKQRKQRATRIKIRPIDEEAEESPTNSKNIAVKLQFESPDKKVSNDTSISRTGRPVRGCRNTSRVVYIEVEPSPQITRQSKQALKSKNTVNNVTVSGTLSSDEEQTGGNSKCVQLKRNEKPATNKENSNLKGISVKDRTKAYESMMKEKMNSSPVLRSQSPLMKVPGSGKKPAPIIVNISSPSGLNPKLKDMNNSNKKRLSKDRTAQQSLVQKVIQTAPPDAESSDKASSDSDAPQQKRTRLRLKKLKQEESVEVGELEHPVVVASPNSVMPEQAQKSTTSSDDDGHLQDLTVDYKQMNKPNFKYHNLNETETMITEVFDIEDGEPPVLRQFEIVHTKTTPACSDHAIEQNTRHVSAGCKSDQGFNDGEEDSARDTLDEGDISDKPQEVKKNRSSSRLKNKKGMSTRTRTRARANQEEDSSGTDVETESKKDSGVVAGLELKANGTYVKDDDSNSSGMRMTRTKSRAQKETNATSEVVEKSTRTRQRKIENDDAEADARPARTYTKQQKNTETQNQLAVNKQGRVHGADRLLLCGSDEEVIASSPGVPNIQRSSLRLTQKRFAEERGLSPRPKRSCVADQSSVNPMSPQLASSPIKNMNCSILNETRDMVASPRRVNSPRAFKFFSAQKKTSGFLNRTPGFAQNTSKLYSFLSNTPTQRSNSVLSSFLKRSSPPPKATTQFLQEQKRQKLLEKENRDKERLRKAAELRKRKIEDQKRLREEKEQKVAEAREERQRTEQEQKKQLHRKLEDKATVKEKVLEERCKEEREKQKLRLKKQMEADVRRKQEDDERLKKLLELEEEAKKHADFMQRKREHEEAERRRLIAEEKRKQEERLAELELKRQEEKARLKLIEEEKEKERERFRMEKEKQLAQEKIEREKLERERREEKERKLQEEMEKLRAMEKERLKAQQDKLLKHKQEDLEQNTLKQMINKHNSNLSKQTSSSSLNTSVTHASNNSNISSYDMTPVRDRSVIAKNKYPENYDIADKNSDESTDDEEAPKKQIPEWAKGIPLNTALIKQYMNPPDLDAIFQTYQIQPPNLTLVFPNKKRARYIQRTSSAIWNSPPMSKH